MRKIIERQGTTDQTTTRLKKRLCIGGLGFHRKDGGNGSTMTLEPETLHTLDDKQRFALVETRTRR